MSRRTCPWVYAALLIGATLLFSPAAGLAVQAASPVATGSPAVDPCAATVSGTPASSATASADVVSFDLAFIDMMIPHHRSAVAMAQVALTIRKFAI